jgi:hypothetical protein
MPGVIGARRGGGDSRYHTLFAYAFGTFTRVLKLCTWIERTMAIEPLTKTKPDAGVVAFITLTGQTPCRWWRWDLSAAC